jgi:NDP-sugar pyrophosphorylase family protein
VAGAAFLSHLLQQLARAKFREVVLLVGYGADRVKDEFGDRSYGLKIRYSEETQQLGTGGAARLALPLLSGKTVLLMNGDSYCRVDLDAFAKSHFQRGGRASLTLAEVEDASRFGRVAMDEEGRIRRFEEKSPVARPGWINAGVYLIERELFEVVEVDTPCSLERDLLPKWVSGRIAFGFSGAEFIDIGVPESYARADAFFRDLKQEPSSRLAIAK